MGGRGRHESKSETLLTFSPESRKMVRRLYAADTILRFGLSMLAVNLWAWRWQPTLQSPLVSHRTPVMRMPLMPHRTINLVAFVGKFRSAGTIQSLDYVSLCCARVRFISFTLMDPSFGRLRESRGAVSKNGISGPSKQPSAALALPFFATLW